MQFNQRMAELQGRYRASLDALDRVRTGVILMDDNGRILEMNRAAREILNQNDGLTAKREGLSASTSNQTRELRAGIAAAAFTARGKGLSSGLSSGGSLRIVRPSGKRPFTLVVMPASVHAFPPEAKGPAVIVFVSDLEARIEMAPEVLVRLYGLTGAESRLAEQLIQGESLVDAAEQLGISHNTARTHLQRIYEKTDVRHQAELVRLLLAGVGNLQPMENCLRSRGDE